MGNYRKDFDKRFNNNGEEKSTSSKFQVTNVLRYCCNHYTRHITIYLTVNKYGTHLCLRMQISSNT